MVAHTRTWNSAVCWLSPTCSVVRQQREAEGQDGERYAWSRLYVGEVRDGRLASVCQFELDDEECGIRVRRGAGASDRQPTGRHQPCNRVGYRVVGASQDRDIDAVVAAYSDQFTYDDRRRLSGDPVTTRAELRAAVERIGEQYSRFEAQTLAVRGERLQLARTRWSDDAGNETTILQVIELGGDGRIDYHAAFDEDDFVGAYRELENRYFAGEGAAFAEAGAVTTDYDDRREPGGSRLALRRSHRSRAFTSRTAHARAFPIARPRNIKPASTICSRRWTRCGCGTRPRVGSRRL